MSFFGKILEKLGLKKAAAEPAPAPKVSPPPVATPVPAPVPKAPPPPQPIAVVDVVAQLEKLAAANSQKLNWKSSTLTVASRLARNLRPNLAAPPI